MMKFLHKQNIYKQNMCDDEDTFSCLNRICHDEVSSVSKTISDDEKVSLCMNFVLIEYIFIYWVKVTTTIQMYD